MRFLLLIALLFPMTLHAQWDVLLSNTMPNTAKLHAHGTVLFHYGDTTTRSEDAGKTWSTVTGLTDRVTSMVSIDADVYALRMQSPPGAMIFLKSTDKGVTWTQISTPQVTNNGVINDLVYDGTTLYGVSNRNEVFVSTDKGVTWTKRTYTTSTAESAADGTLASSGMYVLSSGGLYRSTDSGLTWVKHSTTQGLTVQPTQVETVNDDVFVIGTFGLQRWNQGSQKWDDVSSTLPDFAGSFKASLRDIRASGTALYAVGATFDGASFALTSTDRGTTWTKYLDMPKGSSVSRRAIAFVQPYIIVFHKGTSATENGYYRAQIAAPTEVPPANSWPSAFSGIAPDAALNLPFNNIGMFNSQDGRIYSCVRLQSTNSTSEEGAAPRFDIAFDIVDLQQGIIRVNKTRNFNAQNALTTGGQTPSCSGVFASSTGRYEDFIKVGTDTFSFRFDLSNAAALELKLVTMVKK